MDHHNLEEGEILSLDFKKLKKSQIVAKISFRQSLRMLIQERCLLLAMPMNLP